MEAGINVFKELLPEVDDEALRRLKEATPEEALSEVIRENRKLQPEGESIEGMEDIVGYYLEKYRELYVTEELRAQFDLSINQLTNLDSEQARDLVDLYSFLTSDEDVTDEDLLEAADILAVQHELLGLPRCEIQLHSMDDFWQAYADLMRNQLEPLDIPVDPYSIKTGFKALTMDPTKTSFLKASEIEAEEEKEQIMEEFKNEYFVTASLLREYDAIKAWQGAIHQVGGIIIELERISKTDVMQDYFNDHLDVYKSFKSLTSNLGFQIPLLTMPVKLTDQLEKSLWNVALIETRIAQFMKDVESSSEKLKASMKEE